MVHIPVFGIDVPEPRISLLLPDAIEFIIKLGARGIDAFQETIYPLDENGLVTYIDHFETNFPREFHRVRARAMAGKLDNSEHLSSEAEEASYDWYRRMIRTATIGESGDEQEDMTAFKLGLDEPSIQAAVLDQFKAEQEQAEYVMDPFEEALYSKVSDDPFMQLAARNAAREELYKGQMALAAQKAAEEVEARDGWLETERKIAGSGKVVALSTLNAGAGAALGLLLFRVFGLAWKFAFKSSGRKSASKDAARVKRQIKERAAAKAAASTKSSAADSRAAAESKTAASSAKESKTAAAAAADKASKTSKKTETKASSRPTARKR